MQNCLALERLDCISTIVFSWCSKLSASKHEFQPLIGYLATLPWMSSMASHSTSHDQPHEALTKQAKPLITALECLQSSVPSFAGGLHSSLNGMANLCAVDDTPCIVSCQVPQDTGNVVHLVAMAPGSAEVAQLWIPVPYCGQRDHTMISQSHLLSRGVLLSS